MLDTYTGADINALCDRYDGFPRFAKLLERLAEGIAMAALLCLNERVEHAKRS